PLVQHHDWTSCDLVFERQFGDRRRLTRFGGEPLYGRGHRRFQWRRQERHPLVQHHDRTRRDLGLEPPLRDLRPLTPVRRRAPLPSPKPAISTATARATSSGTIPRPDKL